MAVHALFHLNSNLLQIRGLRNKATGAYVNGGVTVAADLVPIAGGAAITGTPITLTYVTGSNGDWQGILPADLPVALASLYRARLTADGGVNLRGYWELTIKVVGRE